MIEPPFLVRGQTCTSRLDLCRTKVCTWGDEGQTGDPTPRSERRGEETPKICDLPMREPYGASAIDIQPDPETGVAPGFTRCRNMRSRCRCSMCPAIHINSRSWLRSSSTHEPSDPPLRVVMPTALTAAYCVQTCTRQGSGRDLANQKTAPFFQSKQYARYEKAPRAAVCAFQWVFGSTAL